MLITSEPTSRGPDGQGLEARKAEIGGCLYRTAQLLGLPRDGGLVRITLETSRGNLLTYAAREHDPGYYWRRAFPITDGSDCGPDPALIEGLRRQVKLTVDPKFGELDCDTLMVLSKLDLAPGSSVLEVGANEEPTACILTGNGHRVTAVDLRPHRDPAMPVDHLRLEGDFVRLAPALRAEQFDAAISTSALEHFGLGTYGEYDLVVDPDYDAKAVASVRRLLKPGGLFFVTVPYGCRFYTSGTHWRVYDKTALQERIIQDFTVVEKVFFKSADAGCPDDGGRPVPLVREEDADAYEPGDHPHLTVYLCLQKGAA